MLSKHLKKGPIIVVVMEFDVMYDIEFMFVKHDDLRFEIQFTGYQLGLSPEVMIIRIL